MTKKQDFVVGKFTVKPGERLATVVEFMVDGKPYALPIFLVNGSHPGPTLAVTGGVHAAEYASIAAALEAGQHLKPASLHGQVVIVPVVNMPGFRARSIYICPLDGKNLNRVFPGKADGSPSEQIAHWISQNVIRKADAYVDMHGGDLVEALVPFTIFYRTGNPQVDEKSLEIAQVFGIPYLVASGSKGSAFSSGAEAGVPSILTEAGGQGIWQRKNVRLHLNGLRRLMLHMGMLQGEKPKPVQTTIFNKSHWLTSEYDGYYYTDVTVGQVVSKGEYLGKITDFEGKVLHEIYAPDAGTVLYLVTSLVINKKDPLLALGCLG